MRGAPGKCAASAAPRRAGNRRGCEGSPGVLSSCCALAGRVPAPCAVPLRGGLGVGSACFDHGTVQAPVCCAGLLGAGADPVVSGEASAGCRAVVGELLLQLLPCSDRVGRDGVDVGVHEMPSRHSPAQSAALHSGHSSPVGPTVGPTVWRAGPTGPTGPTGAERLCRSSPVGPVSPLSTLSPGAWPDWSGSDWTARDQVARRGNPDVSAWTPTRSAARFTVRSACPAFIPARMTSTRAVPGYMDRESSSQSHASSVALRVSIPASDIAALIDTSTSPCQASTPMSIGPSSEATVADSTVNTCEAGSAGPRLFFTVPNRRRRSSSSSGSAITVDTDRATAVNALDPMTAFSGSALVFLLTWISPRIAMPA